MATKKSVLKSKMVDLGKKMGGCCEPISTKKVKDEKYYPSIYLDKDQAQFLRDEQVGAKRRFIIETILKSKTISSHKDREDNLDVNLEIQKIGTE